MTRDFPTPPTLAERAVQWLASPGPSPAEPVPPRPAATVVLVRDPSVGDDGPEIFLLRRQRTMAFAAGMLAFPGGGVDARDGDDLDLPWAGPAPHAWASRMGVPAPEAVSLVCAAVRETFEECGVLLAGAAGRTEVVDVRDPSWETDRQRLLSRDVALSDLLVERSLVLRSDLLRPFAHWTTPDFEPRRYDTWFFLALVPPEQRARHLGGEASASGWLSARRALADHEAGSVAMLPPTQVAVEDVAAFASVEELWGASRDLTEVVPRLVDLDGVVVLRTELPARRDGAAR